MRWRNNIELFKNELKEGYKWQLKVAEYLRQFGLEANVPELNIRKSIKDINEYRDLEDIECYGRIIEVKSRRVDFNSPIDFPYKTIFIDTVNSWNNKTRKPDAYICVSVNTEKMITLPTRNTFQYWTKSKRFDRVRKIKEEFYECVKELWFPIEDLIGALKSEIDKKY